MARRKIICLFGTRPEAIKMAPVIAACRARPELETVVVSTGQHREMVAQVLSLFDIHPDVDLSVMRPDQGLNGLFARLLSELDPLLTQMAPARVLVHGDTSTAAAAAVACFHHRIPVGHVEAGLRTFDLMKPWPEEFNRQLIDLVADQLFAPTDVAAANLKGAAGRVYVTGNTVIDALLQTSARLDARPEWQARAAAALPERRPGRKLVLVTAHRRESFGEGFRQICQALAALAARPDVEIVYPVHLNPNVQGPVHAILGGRDNIHLVPPAGYLEFVYMMRCADLILTDSGGVQEEAPSLGKPVLVMRDVTERPEAVAAGTVRLVGADAARITAAAHAALDDPAIAAAARLAKNPYGDGHAATRIAALVAEQG